MDRRGPFKEVNRPAPILAYTEFKLSKCEN
jgi:hypothetical protein